MVSGSPFEQSSTANSERGTENSSCVRCSSCCRWPGHVLLTDADIARLALALGLAEPELIDRYTVLAANRAQLSLADREGRECVFLQGNACSVYEARPDQCRDFPRQWGRCPGRSK
jgi:uncharacterized protein